jgi:hypothetical protein
VFIASGRAKILMPVNLSNTNNVISLTLKGIATIVENDAPLLASEAPLTRRVLLTVLKPDCLPVSDYC